VWSIEDANEERAMSWITFAMIAVVVLGGVGVWLMRDRLFGSGQPKVDPVVEHQKQLAAELEPQYEQARQKLIKKQFPEAAEAFYKISTQPEVPRAASRLDRPSPGIGAALRRQGDRVASRILPARGA
jgi:hypothetical protein